MLKHTELRLKDIQKYTGIIVELSFRIENMKR